MPSIMEVEIGGIPHRLCTTYINIQINNLLRRYNPMSIKNLKSTNKAIRFRLGMGFKLTELSEAVADYYGSEPNDAELSGIKLAKSYGFQTRPRTITEVKTFEEIVENLAVLSIQNMNLLRFHKDAEEIYESLAFDYSKIRKAPIDSKLLIYIKSRIEWNSKTYDLDENYYPKELCTYNEAMLNAFKNAGKTFVFFDTIKDLANAPSKKIVKNMKMDDKAYIGRVLVCKASYIKSNYDWLLSKRKIALLY